MNTTTVLQQIFNGISVGCVYALIAAGITTTLGLTGLMNFAHGDFATVAAYIVVILGVRGGLGLLYVLPIAALAMGILLVLAERTLFRRTMQRPINGFLVSLGLIAILENIMAAAFSTVPRVVNPAFASVWTLGNIRMPAENVFTIGVTLVVFGILFAFLRWTWWGTATRAAAADSETIELLGIPRSRIISGTFFAAGILAGISGVLLSGSYSITPDLGATFVVKGFAIAIIGGLGSISGTIVIALVLSIAESLSVGFGLGGWSDAFFFVLLYVILIVRPQGLFRTAS
jgi:branched-chain amino acid transport system permease protein